MSKRQTDWREHGMRILRGDRLDASTPRAPGMPPVSAINHANAGAQKRRAGHLHPAP
jgi:hypothetical protein